jgi:hypothetical protein
MAGAQRLQMRPPTHSLQHCFEGSPLSPAQGPLRLDQRALRPISQLRQIIKAAAPQNEIPASLLTALPSTMNNGLLLSKCSCFRLQRWWNADASLGRKGRHRQSRRTVGQWRKWKPRGNDSETTPWPVPWKKLKGSSRNHRAWWPCSRP